MFKQQSSERFLSNYEWTLILPTVLNWSSTACLHRIEAVLAIPVSANHSLLCSRGNKNLTTEHMMTLDPVRVIATLVTTRNPASSLSTAAEYMMAWTISTGFKISLPKSMIVYPSKHFCLFLYCDKTNQSHGITTKLTSFERLYKENHF